jgi:arginyl-tRNA synthetase
VIAAELRQAILAAAGAQGEDPLLRPGQGPGSYASSLPFRLGPRRSRGLAQALAARPWIARAQLTGPGYLTVTVTQEALAGLAPRIARAGPACAQSDALAGREVPAPAGADLAARLTARLAAAAGATLIFCPERTVVPPPAAPSSPSAARNAPVRSGQKKPLTAAAIEYAGRDAVRFALARTPPGGPAPDPAAVARHVLGNPAYAVRYAHAAAAAVLRWAAACDIRPAAFRPRLLAQPGELALLDALSWLPERVAVAARRGRPDEFARYLEGLAARTLDVMSTTGFRKVSDIGSERLWLADAARTGLAAGLGLLGVRAPERL